MKEFKVNDKLFKVPRNKKMETAQEFCYSCPCTTQKINCHLCIFSKQNASVFEIWIQDEDCVNNFLQGKE